MVKPALFQVLPPVGVRVAILMYHHVDNDPEPDPLCDGGTYPQDLRAQLQAVKARGYTFITLTELMKMRAGDRAISPRPVLLSFDDGYVDFLATALPILQEVGAVATAFIYTGGGDSNVLSWDELKMVRDSGVVDIQGHTVTHPRLTHLSDAELRAELADSKQVLESHLGLEVRYLAYPYGDYDERVIQFAWQAGYGAAVKAWRGMETDSANKWVLKRTSVRRGFSADQVLAMVGEPGG